MQSHEEKIMLVEDDLTLTQDAKNAEILNNFLSKAIKNWNIQEFEKVKPSAGKNQIQYRENFSNIVNNQASILLIILPIGQHRSILMC